MIIPHTYHRLHQALPESSDRTVGLLSPLTLPLTLPSGRHVGRTTLAIIVVSRPVSI